MRSPSSYYPLYRQLYLRPGLVFVVGVLVWAGGDWQSFAAESGRIVETVPPVVGQKVDLIRIEAIVNSLPPVPLEIRGQVEQEKAIDLEQWLVPLDRTLKLLEIQQQQLPNGQIELTSPYLLTRLNPWQWKSHPQLGRVITVGELQKLPGLKVEFIGKSTTLKFSYTLPKNPPQAPPTTPKVTLEGLPIVNPPIADLSAIQQRINLSGSANNQLNAQGEFKAVGTILGSSWYLRVDQPKLSNLLTWGLTDTVVVNQNNKADWIAGSQTPFWRKQGNPTGTYWGVTTIQRQDFTPPTSISGGDFVPNERLQSSRIGRTVTGEAPPGTVVRLARGFSTNVFGQVLVDSSGIFRFENVPVSNGGEFGSNYRLLLYPRGQLTADPQVREVTFTTVPGQLPAGSSAWIASAGLNYNRLPDAFIGNFDRIQGGVGYRRGVSEAITVGGGLIYDPVLRNVGGESIYDGTVRGVGEVFWQPTGVPLQASISAVTGDKWDMVSNVNYQPAPNINASFNGDKFSNRANVNWQIIPQLTATSQYDSKSGVGFGGTYNFSLLPDSSTTLQGTLDSNYFVRWSANHQQNQWQVRLQGNEVSLNSEVSYTLPASVGTSQTVVANYQTSNSGFSTTLGQFTWKYQSTILQTDFGYGWSGFGSGANAGIGLTLLPGLQLLGRYQGISAFSNRENFSLELQSSLDLQGGAKVANARVEDLRNRGGIVIEAFFDRNANGKKDPGEDSYWQPELVTLDRQPLDLAQTTQFPNRVEIKAAPGSYRLDVTPAHLPAYWRSTVSSFRVNVAPGTYTSTPIPLTPIYTVIGMVTDGVGKPLANTQVIATPMSDNSASIDRPIIVTTQSDGRYSIADLAPANYQISLPGQPNLATVNIYSGALIVQQVDLVSLPPTDFPHSVQTVGWGMRVGEFGR